MKFNSVVLPAIGLSIAMTMFTGREISGAAPQIEFVDQFNKRFESRRPKVGTDMFDKLEAFDEQGNALKLSSLKGKHTVIVFGCLT